MAANLQRLVNQVVYRSKIKHTEVVDELYGSNSKATCADCGAYYVRGKTQDACERCSQTRLLNSQIRVTDEGLEDYDAQAAKGEEKGKKKGKGKKRADEGEQRADEGERRAEGEQAGNDGEQRANQRVANANGTEDEMERVQRSGGEASAWWV